MSEEPSCPYVPRSTPSMKHHVSHAVRTGQHPYRRFESTFGFTLMVFDLETSTAIDLGSRSLREQWIS